MNHLLECSLPLELRGYPLHFYSFAQGTMLARRGEPLVELRFLLHGKAKVYTAMSNGRTVLHTHYEGFQVIGDMELMLGKTEIQTDVQAITDGEAAVLDLRQYGARVMEDGALLRLFGRELAKKLERSSAQSAKNLLYPLSARLADYILVSQKDGLFCEHLGRLSELLGVSYRHLLRTLEAFCGEEILERTGDGYRVLNPERLLEKGSDTQ